METKIESHGAFETKYFLIPQSEDEKKLINIKSKVTLVGNPTATMAVTSTYREIHREMQGDTLVVTFTTEPEPDYSKLTYEEIIFEMSSKGSSKNEIDKVITQEKLRREKKYQN